MLFILIQRYVFIIIIILFIRTNKIRHSWWKWTIKSMSVHHCFDLSIDIACHQQVIFSFSKFILTYSPTHMYTNVWIHKYIDIHDYRFPNLYSFFFQVKNFLSIFVYSVHCSRINWSIPNCDDYISHSLVHEYLRKFSSIPSYIKGHIYVHHLIQSNCFNHYQHKDKYLKKTKMKFFIVSIFCCASDGL